ncbi:MAG: hypothetical protein RLP15_08300 [Cryomorphaceae bacterium]
MNEKITFLNNFRFQKELSRKIISLKEIINLYNEKSDRKFTQGLKNLGYQSALESLRRRAQSIVINEDWEDLEKHWSYLAFFHYSIYNCDEIDLLKFTKINRYSMDPISRGDFIDIEGIPNNVFDVIKKKAKKGVYSLFKELNPGIVFGTFNAKSDLIECSEMDSHTQLMALDIDLPIDNNQEVIDAISKHFSIYSVLMSPSNTIRPILKIDLSDEALLNFKKWKSNGYTKTDLNKIRATLVKEYQTILFNKVNFILSHEYFTSEGKLVRLKIDSACKNPNRLWFLGRPHIGKFKTKRDAISISLKRQDCIDFGGKDSWKFRVYNDIFNGF